MTVGVLVIIGWIFDWPLLKSILPIWVTMKFTTAVSFFFSGLMLFFMTRFVEGKQDLAGIIVPLSVLVIVLLMSTLLISVFVNVQIGLEDLFVKEPIGAVRTTVPGRPSIGTMVSFLLAALSGILIMLDKPGLKKGLSRIGWTIFLIGLIAVVGYVFNLPGLYYNIADLSTAMAIHTAILFSFFGAGLILLTKI